MSCYKVTRILEKFYKNNKISKKVYKNLLKPCERYKLKRTNSDKNKIDTIYDKLVTLNNHFKHIDKITKISDFNNIYVNLKHIESKKNEYVNEYNSKLNNQIKVLKEINNNLRKDIRKNKILENKFNKLINNITEKSDNIKKDIVEYINEEIVPNNVNIIYDDKIDKEIDKKIDDYEEITIADIIPKKNVDYDETIFEEKTSIPIKEYVKLKQDVNELKEKVDDLKKKLNIKLEDRKTTIEKSLIQDINVVELNKIGLNKRYRIAEDADTFKEMHDNIIKYHKIFIKKVNEINIVIYIKPDNKEEKIRYITLKDIDYYDYDNFIKILQKYLEEDVYGSDQISDSSNIVTNIFDMYLLKAVESGFGKGKPLFFDIIDTDNINCEEMCDDEDLIYNGKIYTREDHKKFIKQNSKILCGYRCLRYLIKDLKLTAFEYVIKKLYNYVNLKQFLFENNYHINIIGDFIRINEKEFEKLKDDAREKTSKKLNTCIKDNKRTYDTGIVKISDYKYEPVIISDGSYKLMGPCLGIIIFDMKKQHYSVYKKFTEEDDISYNYKDFINIKDTLYMTMNTCIVENIDNEYIIKETARDIGKIRDLYVPPTNDNKASVEYIIFDYETIVDWKADSVCKPYSLAFIHLSRKEMKQLEIADNKGDELIIDLNKLKAHFHIGFDCTKYLLKYIQENNADKIFQLVSFNGSNFDNHILYYDLMNLNVDTLSDPFFNGTRLLNFKMDGRHQLFDIRRHLLGSLKDNCVAFKIKCCSKKEFDHKLIQQKYDEGVLFEYLKDNEEELKTYNIYDILATAVLYQKYSNIIKAIPGLEKYGKFLHDYKTIGSMMKTIIEEDIGKKKITLPIFKSKNKEESKKLFKFYNDMIRDRCGGRVQLFNGKKIYRQLIASLDVCSLYPFVMCVYDVYYPCGNLEMIDDIGLMPHDCIGFFYCDVDQSNIDIKIIPKKSKTGNDWDCNEKIEKMLLSTIKINLLRKYGCKVTTYEGFYFDKKVKSCELFGSLLPLMKLKNEQDIYKNNKDDRYNGVLREVLKLQLNAPSGKMSEGLHPEKYERVGIYRLNELMNNKDISDIKCINMSDQLIVSYKRNEEKCMAKSNPIYIGMLIYDYAHQYMYENIFSKIDKKDLIYTDTDSAKMLDIIKNKWVEDYGSKNIVPHWPELEKIDERYKEHKLFENDTKVFGSFDNETKGFKHDYNVFLDKKNYLNADCNYYNNSKEFNDKNTKMIFKGVGKKDVFINDTEYEIINDIINLIENHGDMLNKINYDNCMNIDNNIIKAFIKTCQEKKFEKNKFLYDFYNEANKIKDDYVALFNQLYLTGKANILTMCSSRIIQKDKVNKLGENKNHVIGISFNYRIKQININK